MTPAAVSIDTHSGPAPRLRLVDGPAPVCATNGSREREQPAAMSRPAGHLAHVLVAGASASDRERMLGELRDLLPATTRFLEACETWELLARAADSRMVVLTDDLGEMSSGSLVRLLGRRHPALPVLAVGGRARATPWTDAEPARM